MTVYKASFFKMLLGGDQHTAVRGTAAFRICTIPAIKDWQCMSHFHEGIFTYILLMALLTFVDKLVSTIHQGFSNGKRYYVPTLPPYELVRSEQ